MKKIRVNEYAVNTSVAIVEVPYVDLSKLETLSPRTPTQTTDAAVTVETVGGREKEEEEIEAHSVVMTTYDLRKFD